MTSMAAIAATRRLKWHYQQVPQTPRILHLPRRPSRRKVPKSHLKKPTSGLEKKGKLEALFDQERAFSRDSVPIVLLDCGGESGGRRERVEVEESRNGSGTVVEEEQWKFQAEMLRAECNLLRMEREIAVKKFERTKVQTQGALTSAVQTLSSGQKQICEGKNVKMVLEEAILDLGEKLEELRKSSAATNDEVQNPSNFDKHSHLLKKRLEKIEKTDEIKEIQELALINSSAKSRHWLDRISDRNRKDKLTVDILKSKMEGLSSGTLLKRMKDECGSMLSTASTSLASSASNSKRLDFLDPSFSKQKTHQDSTSTDDKACSRRCKAIIRRIIELIGAETEQWSQMQEMLSQVREEMEELQIARVFWEDRAVGSFNQTHSLRSQVEEWRERAIWSESKADELEGQISVLSEEVERLRIIDKRNKLRTRTESKGRSSPPIEAQDEMEKRVLVCRTNRSCKDDCIASRRSPLGDIGNASIPARRDMKLIPCSRYETHG